MEDFWLYVLLFVVLGLPVFIEIISLPKQLRRIREKHERKTAERKARAYAMMKEYDQRAAEEVVKNNNNMMN